MKNFIVNHPLTVMALFITLSLIGGLLLDYLGHEILALMLGVSGIINLMGMAVGYLALLIVNRGLQSTINNSYV